MRLGVIADVHGNALALEAVLDRMDRLSLDMTVNLGDCASGPLWPAEATKILRDSGFRHVRGNHDRAMGSETDTGLGLSDAYAWQSLDQDARDWLSSLPFSLVLDGVSCFHATPASDETYLMETVTGGRLQPAPPVEIASRLGAATARLILCGHSHQPRLAQLADGTVIVNPGSIGCPAYDDATTPAHVSESGSPHARFAVVTIHGGEIAVEHHAVTYDWARAAQRAAENGRPEWAHALLTGTAL